MKKERQPVRYSFEHGDPSLPQLKDLVSETPDPMKAKIIAYLKTNCIAVSSGKVRDEVYPQNFAGSGNVYADDAYTWTDTFYHYVNRYNIPVPTEFRNHILENNESRMQRHLTLRLVDKIKITVIPRDFLFFHAYISRTGKVTGADDPLCTLSEIILKQQENTENKIEALTTELFCYDTGEHGKPARGGYKWELTFNIKGQRCETIKGHPGEDPWRYQAFMKILRYAEDHLQKSLGSDLMPAVTEEE